MGAKPGIYEPVDPNAVSAAYLKRRVSLLFAALDRGELAELPVRPGWFRCFVCRRAFEKGVPDDEAAEEYRRRFGDGEPDPLFTVCDDCNRIVSEDQGVPLLWRSPPLTRSGPGRSPASPAGSGRNASGSGAMLT